MTAKFPVFVCSFYDEAESLSDAIDEMFDMTFPPVRYRSARYLPVMGASQGEGMQQQQQQQQRQIQRSRFPASNKIQVARLDVSHYRPEEVSCKVEDGKVLVTGKHYSENEFGYEATEFHRSYSLPEGVDPRSVKSRISQDGVLQIEASKEQPKPLVLTSDEGVDETDDKKLALKIDLSGFKPEEVNVRVKGNELTVSAEHKSQDEGHYTHRHFKRSFSLPEEVDISTLSSKFTKDGMLNIQAEKKDVPAIEEKKIEVEEDDEMKEG